MRTILVLCSLMMLSITTPSTPKRDLGTFCQDIPTCNACTFFSECQYLNGSCQAYDPDLLKFDEFDQEHEYKYCKNAIINGPIVLNGIELVLGTKLGANSTSHSLCEWRFSSETVKDFDIQVIRNTQAFESIRVEYTTENGAYSEITRLSDCFSESTEITLSSVTFVTIKVKILDDRSDYIIKIDESDPRKPSTRMIPNLIIFFAVFIPSMCLVVGIMLILCCCYKTSRVYSSNQRSKSYPDKLKYIKEVIDNMKAGKFKNINTEYNQSSCVICIDDFNDDSKIVITNECSHVFHLVCLHEWFENMRASHEVKCPICSTTLSNKASKKRKVKHDHHSDP